MSYIKFIAKKDSWFKPGDEVLWEDGKWLCRRPTTEEYTKIAEDGMAVFVGYRPDGIFDGELCPLDEFDIQVVDRDTINIQR